MTKQDIAHAIRMGGVVGMGGAGFPTHVKLSPPEDKPIKYIIVNAAECEPYLTSDDRRIVEQGEDVVDGLKICMELLGLETGYIGIEANKPEAYKKLKEIGNADTTSYKVGTYTRG